MMVKARWTIFLAFCGILSATAFEVKNITQSVAFSEGEKTAEIAIPEEYRLCDADSPLCMTACATVPFSTWGMKNSALTAFKKTVNPASLLKDSVMSHPNKFVYCASLCGCALWDELKESECDGNAKDKRLFIELPEVALATQPPAMAFMVLEQTREDAKKRHTFGVLSVFSIPAARKCVLGNAVKDLFTIRTARAMIGHPPSCKTDNTEATHKIFETVTLSNGVPISAELPQNTLIVMRKTRQDIQDPLRCDSAEQPQSPESADESSDDKTDNSLVPPPMNPVPSPPPTNPESLSAPTKPRQPGAGMSLLVGSLPQSEQSFFAVMKSTINSAEAPPGIPVVLPFRLMDGKSLCSVDMPPCVTVCVSPNLKISKVELRTKAQHQSVVLPTSAILADSSNLKTDCQSICACELYAAMKKQPNEKWCESSTFEVVVTATEFAQGEVVGFVSSAGTLSEPTGKIEELVTAAVIPSHILRCTLEAPSSGHTQGVRYIASDKVKKGTLPECQTSPPSSQSGKPFYEVLSTTSNDWLVSNFFKKETTRDDIRGSVRQYMCYNPDWKWQAHSIAAASSEGVRSVVNLAFPSGAKGLSSWNPCSVKEPVCIGVCYPPQVIPTKIELSLPGATSPVTLKTSVTPNESVSNGKACAIACGCAVFEAMEALDPKAVCKPVGTREGAVSLTVTLDQASSSQLEGVIISGGSKKPLASDTNRITASTTLTSFLQDAGENVCVSQLSGLTPSYIRKTTSVSLQSATAVPACQKVAPPATALKDYWVLWSTAPRALRAGDQTDFRLMMPFVSRPETLLRCEQPTASRPQVIRGKKPVKDAAAAARDRAQRLVASAFYHQADVGGVKPKQREDHKTIYDLMLPADQTSVLCAATTPFVLSVCMPQFTSDKPSSSIVINKGAGVQLHPFPRNSTQNAECFFIDCCPLWDAFRAGGTCTVKSVEIHVEHDGPAPQNLLYLISGSQIPSTVKPGNNVTVLLADHSTAIWMPASVQCRSPVQASETFKIASSQETKMPRCLAAGYGPTSDEELVGSAYIVPRQKIRSEMMSTTFTCAAPESSALPVFSNYTLAISSILGFCMAFSPFRKHRKAEY